MTASTSKSAYKSDNCKKLMADAVNEHSIEKSNRKVTLSTETECAASRFGDKDSLSAQLETVSFNGICTRW
jgi:hypothetical protein